ncbi:MAG: DUF4912 domain-containing protein [Verrucomicrobia bacterium]|nr:DUF4912 domain-containing protein [Verrucomicrobiota bacterium]
MKPDKSRSPKNRKPAAKAVPSAAKPAARAAKKTDSAVRAVSAQSASRKKPVKIPALLLEGDTAPTPAASGPGQRYALGPGSAPPHLRAEDLPAELPEAYGTKALLLTARDPHWLYAHWDLTREQLRHYNALSRDRHLVVRVFLDVPGGQPFAEVHVHPESRNWFIHVGRGGAKFFAELGYYAADGAWSTISSSKATLTPPDDVSADASARFVNIPLEVPFAEILRAVEESVGESKPLAEAIHELRATIFPDLPEVAAAALPARWTPAQERALAQAVSMDEVRRVWIGSLEITELIRRQLRHDVSSMAAAQFSAPTSPARALGSVSSPFGGAAERKQQFWFNVNAELIIYGATEPDARVSIGGRRIKLRKDGTFSYRFALPDGKYELPAVAVAADESDGRAAVLQFSRESDYHGEVGAHPQDAALKPPRVENVG